MSALMVVVLTRASMLVELMSALRLVGLIFAVMLVALLFVMMLCVVVFALMLVVVMSVLTFVVKVTSGGGVEVSEGINFCFKSNSLKNLSKNHLEIPPKFKKFSVSPQAGKILGNGTHRKRKASEGTVNTEI